MSLEIVCGKPAQNPHIEAPHTHPHDDVIFRRRYMDDWISFVYGASHTKKIKSVTVSHETDSHGTRYDIDSLEMDAIEQEFKGGRALIIDYCEQRGLDASLFRSDPVMYNKEVLAATGLNTAESKAVA